MKAKQLIPIIFTTLFLLPGKCLLAQEYLDLWRGGKTDNFYLIQQKFNEYFANREKGQGTGYKQFKRWEEFMAPRVYPSGKLINPSKLALDEELRYQGRDGIARRTAAANGGNWVSLGITSYTNSTGWTGGMGRVNRIVPHPTNPNILFIGTPAGGVWKTTDGGSTWIPLSDGIPIMGVSGIAINPQNPNNIFILTGDGDGADTYSTGVLSSTNGGNTWKSTGLQWGEADHVYGFKLLMHPTDRRMLFAVTNKGIYKTTDGGVSWSIKNPDKFTDMVFKPGNPSVIYATAFNGPLYISYDTGENWEQWPYGAIPGRTVIGVTPVFPNGITLANGTDADGFQGFFLSSDGGQNWASRPASPNILGASINPDNYSTTSQASYDLAIAVSPDNVQEVHVGGINCWKSVDAGGKWFPTSYYLENVAQANKYVHADIHALVFNGQRLYCGSDGGVSYSDDHAATWYDISKGLEITQFYSIASPCNDLNTLYGGSKDNGLNKWTDPATTMDHKVGGDMVQCLVDYSNANTAYTISNGGRVFFTTKNGGSTWSHVDAPSTLTGGWVTPLIMHPADPTKLYAGYNKVALITGNGQGVMTFTPFGPDFNAPLTALGMSVANSSYMYAATATTLKRCTDITASQTAWTTITLPVTNAELTSIQVSPTDVNKLWICFSGYVGDKKVYYSTDGGAQWSNISGTLPNVPVNCIAYHNTGLDGVFIGTDIGVFYKDNTMSDWIPFRNGLPNTIVRDLEITLNKIRAATFGRGIWESNLDGNCPVTLEGTVSVSGNQFSTSSGPITPCICANNYTLSGDIAGYQFFQSANTIASTANIIGGIGTAVSYKATNKITLNTGFTVAAESQFMATIEDCDSSASSSRPYPGIYEGVMAGAVGIASGVDSMTVQTSRLKVYPNPSSGQSTIEFYIAKTTAVNISLWDLSGKKIKVLFESASRAPGNYQVRLDVTGLRSGTYVVRLHAQDYEETKKIVITH